MSHAELSTGLKLTLCRDRLVTHFAYTEGTNSDDVEQAIDALFSAALAADPVRAALVELFLLKPSNETATLAWVTYPSDAETTYKSIGVGAMSRLEAALKLAEGKE